jgi:bacteriocin biosynthesis cyclodehydratase domain-containing protein
MEEKIEIKEMIPRLKKHLTVFESDTNEIQIRDDKQELIVFKGSSINVLLKMLMHADGKRTGAELIKLMEEEKIDSEISENMIQTLIAKGIFEDLHNENQTFVTQQLKMTQIYDLLSRISADKYGYYTLLKDRIIAVIGLNNLAADVVRSLYKLGIKKINVFGIDNESAAYLMNDLNTIVNPGNSGTKIEFHLKQSLSLEWIDNLLWRETPDAIVNTLDPNLYNSFFRSFNQSMVEKKVAWMSAFMIGANMQLGPFYLPGKTACFHCFDLRYKANMTHYVQLVKYQNAAQENHITQLRQQDDFFLFASIGASMVVYELIKHFLQFMLPVTYGAIVDINMDEFKMEYHYVLKLPRCPVCGIKTQILNPFQFSKADNITEEFVVKGLK